MMFFKQFEVMNVGPFKHFQVDLTRGSIGIFGKNGAGKSTLLNLMYGLLTNEWRYGGTKNDLINNTSDAKERAFVRGVVVGNDGDEIEITRNFRTSKSRPNTVVISRGETIVTADKAQEEISTVLGVDRKLLDLYVFKEQDRIYDFLTSTPAERAQAYQVLCRTERCASIHSMLHAWMTTDREANTEVIDTTDDLTQEIAKIDEEIAALERQLSSAKQQMLGDDEVADYTKQIRQVERRAELMTLAERTETAIATTAKQVQELQESADVEFEAHSVLVARLEKRQKTADELRMDLAQATRYATCEAKKKELRKREEELRKAILDLPEPVKPDDVEMADKYTRELVIKEQQVAAAKRIVATFDSDKVVACPTCATPVNNLTEHLNQCRDTLRQVPDEIDALTVKSRKITQYRSSFAKYTDTLRALEQQLNSTVSALESLQTVPAPAYERSQSEKWLQDHATLQAEEKTAAKSLKASQQRLNTLTGELNARKDQLEQTKADIAKIVVTQLDAAEAAAQLKQHRQAELENSRLQGCLRGCQQLRVPRVAELAKLKARLRRSTRVRKMLKVVGVVRDAMHWNNLPRRVATENLLRLEGDINANLTLYGNPFWVEPDTELSFIVHKPGEPPQPASCLSTGQRVVLALSFWPAVASLWASSIGLLGLDEPTANLDTDNRRYLGDALNALTSRIRGNRQLIMVTHDHELRSAFDQVIEIGA